MQLCVMMLMKEMFVMMMASIDAHPWVVLVVVTT